MPGFYDSPQVQKTSQHFKGMAQLVGAMFPTLEWDLRKAGYQINAIQYVSITIYLVMLAFIGCMVVFGVPVAATEKYVILPDGEINTMIFWPFGLAISISAMVFFYSLYAPKIKISSRSRKIDKTLEFMLKDMQVQLTAGVPLFDTLVNISRGQYGECSTIADGIVQEVQSGKSVIDVLDEVGMWSPSDYLRKVLWQIVNAVRSGADMVRALDAIANDIRIEKENKIKAYGQELNLWGLIYLMAAVIVPSMGVTLLVILSSFIGGNVIDESLFWTIMVGLIIFQVIFISFVSSKRPEV
ncbi:MAG: type II secretion system F family protein [Candidatus Altiarchaeota archaeon]